MSEIRINILERDHSVHGNFHGSVGDAIVAALCADPETIDELAFAYSRFRAPDDEYSPFNYFSTHSNFEPYDAGILVIDLASRTIGYESTYSSPSREGVIPIRIDDSGDRFPVSFKLSDEWEFINCIPLFEGASHSRRAERREPTDYRAVLYGQPMIEFILDEVKTNAESGDEDTLEEIHVKWLMTGRYDLGGKTPREVMFERKDHVNSDLSSREMQWSFTRFRPAPLLESFAAYKFAGFGTHEIVVYYDLFRDLLEQAWDVRSSSGVLTPEYLEGKMNVWMDRPEYFGRTPEEIIKSERKRIPLAMKPSEGIVDENCPTCIGLSELIDTPGFWHLDGCEMEERFEFSLFKTREEWEEWQVELEGMSRRIESREYGELEFNRLDEEAAEEPF